MIATTKKKLAPRHCRFCGHSFRPKRKNQRHCRASHRVRDAVRRFWAKKKRDYHVRPTVRHLGKCAYCGKPRIFKRKIDKYCSKECSLLGKKTSRND